MTFRQEQLRWVGNLDQSAIGHLEHADLVGRSEAVLHRAQDSELVPALAFEGQNGVDHVFQYLGAGNRPLLGDMPDQQQGETAAFGDADQLLRAGADLADRSRRAVQVVHVHGLDRVDHDDVRRLRPIQGRLELAHVGGGRQLDRRI